MHTHTRGKEAEAVRATGLRATGPRVALFAYLRRAHRPQTIREIAEGLNGEMDQVTVYRAVAALAGAGLVREVDLQGGRPLYELHDPHDHHHAVCTACGMISKFEEPHHAALVRRAARRVRGFGVITGHSFELFGLCSSCAARAPRGLTSA